MHGTLPLQEMVPEDQHLYLTTTILFSALHPTVPPRLSAHIGQEALGPDKDAEGRLQKGSIITCEADAACPSRATHRVAHQQTVKHSNTNSSTQGGRVTRRRRHAFPSP